MKKIVYIPLWRINKMEKLLHDYENNGWRLDSCKRILLFACFMSLEFKKCKPKDTDYIVTYNMAKDNHRGMFDYMQMLLSENQANAIKSTGYNFFRITGANRNYKDLFEYRNKYFKHILLHRLITSIILFVILTVPCVLSMIYQSANLIIPIGLFLILPAYCLYGYLAHGKHVKQCSKSRITDR